MTDAERAAVVLLVWCGFCWAAPGAACTNQGQHMARYLRVYRRGLVGRDDLTAVCRFGALRQEGMTAPHRHTMRAA